MVAHGFRASFKAWAREHDWADHLSELALAHTDPNEVRAAYARDDLLEKRRPMMEAWADQAVAPDQAAGQGQRQRDLRPLELRRVR